MRHLHALLALAVVGTALSVSLWSAKGDQSTTAQSTDDESLEVQLARAHVELAKLDLYRAVDVNKRAKVFSSKYLDRLRLHVTIDEAELEEHLKGGYAAANEVCIRSAEASVKIAEADLEAWRAAHQRKPMADIELDVKRAGIVAEIAKLNLKRAKQIESPDSVLIHLQGQIDELRHHVLELQTPH